MLTNVLLLPSNLNTLVSAVTCLNLFVYSSYWQFLNYLLVIFWGNNLSRHLLCSFVFMPHPFFPFLGTTGGHINKSITYDGLFIFTWIYIQMLFLRKGLNWEIGDTEPDHCVALGHLYNSQDLSSQAQNEEDPARWSISKVLTTLKPNDSLALWIRSSHQDAICFIKRWLALLLVGINPDKGYISEIV